MELARRSSFGTLAERLRVSVPWLEVAVGGAVAAGQLAASACDPLTGVLVRVASQWVATGLAVASVFAEGRDDGETLHESLRTLTEACRLPALEANAGCSIALWVELGAEVVAPRADARARWKRKLQTRCANWSVQRVGSLLRGRLPVLARLSPAFGAFEAAQEAGRSALYAGALRSQAATLRRLRVRPRALGLEVRPLGSDRCEALDGGSRCASPEALSFAA